jgi:hypothetical protein
MASTADASATTPPLPAITPEQAETLLFVPGGPASPGCADGEAGDRIRCLIAARYATDATAAKMATRLFESTGDVAGLLPEEMMEGGYRGTIHLVPELPIGARRPHLDWVSSVTDYDRFFEQLTEGHLDRVRYRWRALGFRFMRSVKARTPSAYASGWTIAYNLDGSLNTSADAVRELLFHEIFHLNDALHGDWSVGALKPTYAALVARCGTRVDCLTPYAPTSTRVRNGTFYAFQPDNGEAVHEYAAELALRYYREQRDMARGNPVRHPFKCGPEENRRSWKLLLDEFFGGVDRVPACP